MELGKMNFWKEWKNKRPLFQLTVFRRIALVSVATFCLFFAAFPTWLAWFMPQDIVVDRSLKESGQTVKSEWCVRYDGVYNVDLEYPRVSGKDMDAILGQGAYATSGEFRVTQKGVEIPITLTVSQENANYALDTSRAHPVVSRVSRDAVSRGLGRLALPHGCYQSIISLGEIPDSLKGLTATLLLRPYEPTGPVGKVVYGIFGYGMWWAARLYHSNLHPVLWAGFVFCVFVLVYRRRRPDQA